MTGGPGNDILIGGAGDDTISGGAGIDGIEGGAGNDVIDGGLGDNDFAAFFGATSGVSVDLVGGTATGAGTDTLTSIEGVDGSNGDDVMNGNGADNFFAANGGDDTIDGGKGFDQVLFLFAPGPVAASLATGTATGDGTDTLFAIEWLSGSPFADTLNGGTGNDALTGDDGNDTLDGAAGIDYLEGEGGTDTCLNGEQGLTTCEFTSLAATGGAGPVVHGTSAGRLASLARMGRLASSSQDEERMPAGLRRLAESTGWQR
jgi:Ca2+-binding RTX toxin-like protein